MNGLIDWFKQQSQRDQIALMICAVCVTLALLWVVLIQPINQAAATSERRLQSSTASLARIKSMVTNLQYFESQQGQRSRGSQISIVGIIDQSSRAVGLSFSSVNPSANGEQATVRFDNAEQASMLQWLYNIENTYSATIEDLRLNSGQQAGYVSGSIRIKK